MSSSESHNDDRAGLDPEFDPQLDPGAIARGAELVERALAASPDELDDHDEAAELARFLATCRSTLRAADETRDSAPLVDRVLAATTREDLSVRGDLRLLRGWLTDALRSSVLVRVAAASLLLHVFALPVVAAILFFSADREAPTRISFSMPLEDPFLSPEAVGDASVELDLPPDDALFAELTSAAPDPLAVSNALRRARWSLSHGGAPAPLAPLAPSEPAAPGAPVQATDPLERALARRAAALAARDWSRAAPLPSGESGAARVLWLETELDRFALTGALSPDFAATLSSLEFEAAGPLATLERSALARAADYGLLDSGRRERLAAALERARNEAPRAVPVEPDWLAQLEAALPPGAPRGRELRAWLAWGEAPDRRETPATD